MGGLDMTWFLTTRIGRWLAMIGAALAMLAGAVLVGWSKRGQAEAGKALEGYKATRERMDDADDFGNDADAGRRWLRERGKRDGDL